MSRWVGCPDENQLLAYVERTLAPQSAALVEQHLDRCPACLECVSAFVAGPAEPAAGDDDDARVTDRYVLVDVLGCGASGVVYRAFDPVLDRTVALKVIDTGHDARPEPRAAAIREARVLASLSHPNLVTVYDAGVRGHRIFFAMELVEGGDLRAWLSGAPRSVAEIVAVFVGVADGLAAAHEAGVIHRDLKPANILVDGEGRARVADFGLADVVAPQAQRAGTPAYSAPEQREGRPVDARVDQFALCASLYEAVWGQRPPRARPLVLPDGPRVPARIRRAIARGLAEDPRERFASMAALRDALVPPRRPWRWAVGSLVVAASVVVTALATAADDRCSGATQAWGERWGSEPRQRVRAALASAEAPELYSYVDARLSAYAEAWVSMHAETCRASVIRGEQSPAVLDLRMACLQRAAASSDAVIEVLGAIGPEHVDRTRELLATLDPIEACADVEVLQRGLRVPPVELRAQVQSVQQSAASARAWLWAGDEARARRELEQAQRDARVLPYPPLQTELTRLDAEITNQLGDHAAAERLFREVLRLAREQDQPAEVFVAANELAVITGSILGRPDEGLAFAEVARAIAPDARGRALAELSIGEIELARGRLAEAEVALRRALAIDAPTLSALSRHVMRQQLSRTLGMLGRADEAVDMLTPVVAELAVELGPRHPQTAQAQANLAAVERKAGHDDDARVLFEQALDTLADTWPPGHPTTASIRSAYASTLDALGRHAQAEQEHRRALSDLEAALGPRHPSTLSARANLGSTLAKLGRPAEAEAMHREVVTALEPEAHDPAMIAMARNALAVDLLALGRPDEAEAQLVTALELLTQARGACAPPTRLVRYNLARSRRQGRGPEPAAEGLRALLQECAGSAPTPAELEQWRTALAEVQAARPEPASE